MKREDLLKITKEYHQNTDENVIGVGYGYKIVNGEITSEKSIVFTVKEKLPIEELTVDQLLPKKINISNEIISTDVIQGENRLFCDPSFYLWTNTGYTVPNRNTFRPLKCGVSCSNFTSMSSSTGTLGFLAIDNDSGSENSLVGVSNNHVLIDDAFLCSDRQAYGVIKNVSGNVVTQPHEHISDNFPIGVIKKYYPILEQPYYNLIDVALTTIDRSVTGATSYYQEGLSTSTLTFASTSEIDNLLISDPFLYSAGRTTGAKGEGVTKLKIYQLSYSTGIFGYKKQGVDKLVNFEDLIVFVARSGSTPCIYPIYHGDSGSALIADFSGTKKIIGLVFAGSDYYGIACRIDHVATLMNISAWNGESVNYSNPSSTLELDIPGLDSRTYIDHVDGKRYWQVGLKTI